jgi:hypothetical protein
MKKVRIMLMAIAVLTIAGGTLAFNAKFDSKFCYAPTTTVARVETCINDVAVTQTCTAGSNTYTTTDVNIARQCYTPTQNTALCPGKDCPYLARLAVE